MKIGLIDVDSHNYPNLCLMKLSAWHKRKGDSVEWYDGFAHYNRIYMSKVFDETYTPDMLEPANADEVIRGGTGYGLGNSLPDEIEHIRPDYSLYGIAETAYGFLTRGCPRACPFCIVAEKEGRASKKVSDLSEWWGGEKYIELLDPNILACKERIDLLTQLADSGAWVNFSQGLDARLLTESNVEIINRIKKKDIHFAWDRPCETDAVLRGLKLYSEKAERKIHGAWATVYCLTNYETDFEFDRFRVETLRGMGYDPYIMVYDKPNAPKETTRYQRYVNSRIYKLVPFEKYDTRRKGFETEVL